MDIASKLKTKMTVAAATLLTVAASAVTTAAPAHADSCWMHNGSLMRLQASGNRRVFRYENPRRVLRRAGVRPGTVLFRGRKNGDSYFGKARRFSKYCPGNPVSYVVRGPVSSNQLRVVVSGYRPVYERCRFTDSQAWDELVFTYSHQC